MSLPGRFRNSITLRIGVAFLLLLLLTTAAGVLTIRHFIERDLEGGTRQEMLNGMKRMEADIERVREEVLLFSQLAARAAQVREQTADAGATTLQITVVEEARSRGIEIDEFAAGRPDAPDWEVLRRGLAGIRTFDYVLRGEGAGRLHAVAVAPVEGAGRERRVITASVSLGREFLRREKMNLGGDLSLFIGGELVASSSTCVSCQKCIQEVLGKKEHWKTLESGKPIYFTFDCEPEPQAAIAVPMRTFGGQAAALTLFRSRANEELALRHTTLGVIGGGVAVSFIMAAVFFLITSKAIRPLKELTRLSVRISEGRYGETVPVRGEDEVAELARAFNGMSVSLKEASREISEWNRLLERRVAEKTQELEKVHRRMVDVEKLAAVGQLAAGVAHELNNPLTGIMGYAELAQELFRRKAPGEIAPEEAAKMAANFGHIDGLAQRCRTIILDLLTFARHHTEELREVRLNDVLEQTLAFLGKQLDKRNVRVEADLSRDLPLLEGNPLQLQQVFTNLIMNAAQAMPSGGSLAIRTRTTGTAVEAEFADNGTGIDPAHRHRLFEPFFTTKPVGEGTGLGLSVSYGIVQRHRGNILVESEPGKGSVFTVVLPLAPQTADSKI